MHEYNNTVIKNIKDTYWDGESEITFDVKIDEIFRTEKGLMKQIQNIPEASDPDYDVGFGTIFVAVPDDDFEHGVTIIPMTVRREENDQ